MDEEIKKWEELGRKRVFDNQYRKIDEVRYRLPNGNEADFYLKAEGRVATTLALTKDNKVILFEQYRPGPDKIMLELPGGFVEEGEDPVVAAARELLEETGYKGELEFVTELVKGAYTTMIDYVYIAKDCEKTDEVNFDHAEFGKTVLMDLDEFREHIKTGQRSDTAVAYLCLDRLGLL